MKDLDQLLQNNSVFTVLTPVEREQVKAQAVQKRVGKGEALAHNGDVWPFLFVVERGAIQGLKESREGRSLNVIALESGDLFWGAAFFEENAPLPVMLQAQQESRIWLWRREWLLPILWDNGRFSWELSRLMVRRMQRASEIVEELAFQPVRGRLARLLLGHFGDEAMDEFVARDLTLDEMAARVGTKREMVCRLLYQFAEEGAIEISRTEFMITNRDLLEKQAGSAKS
jgi:CRP/FNR family transcriptional regulator